ncbi:lysophospholipase L1-like esterase [Okibacterium sp. HSC-33S16]|uniref:GDSL-type esterase/lipase family protein n=1 Tax=Okibacterium sp. HSC-33S16 TaxID=2910965 RepID=UPI00209F3FE3|nr:GDSL-type esterase/lipase family protein [Okibacterium sp. HSC-33S16]MCP2032066.1 lysophospholipase L1-like esterase [Okibacterium sp. HSC-33S16]
MRAHTVSIRMLIATVATALVLAGCSAPAPKPTAVPSTEPAPFTISAIASLGDSMSLAVNACDRSGSCPEASWSTGTDPEVQSLASRVASTSGSAPTVEVIASDGASVESLPDQAARAVELQPDLVTVLIGANDVCAPSYDEMTPEATFTENVNTAFTALATGLPDARVYVSSVPNLVRLIDAKKDDPSAVATWKKIAQCRSILYNATSSEQADVDRRASISALIDTFNGVLADACAAHPHCIWDEKAAFNVEFTGADVSTIDYFHPSVAGQQKLAAVAWDVLSNSDELSDSPGDGDGKAAPKDAAETELDPAGATGSRLSAKGKLTAPDALVAGPQGSGSSCSTGSPCSLETALGKAGEGSAITLADGNYGSMELTGGRNLKGLASAVVVGPAKGATPTFDRLKIAVPSVTWQGITVTGVMYVNRPAVDTRLENIHVSGTGLFVRSQNVTVSDSLFEGGSSVDGIQVGGASDVLIENNEVRDYDQNKNNGLHADCVQIFDSETITLRANKLSNCYNAGIILSSGKGTGMADILIESNFVQGCIVKSANCQGGSAADLRYIKTTNLVVRNNSFSGGSVRIDPLPGLVFDRNIVAYLADCASPMTNSIVEKWNAKSCSEPDAIGSDGNRTGDVVYVDEEGGDLHLEQAGSAEITPAGPHVPASVDIDGQPLEPVVAGAAATR